MAAYIWLFVGRWQALSLVAGKAREKLRWQVARARFFNGSSRVKSRERPSLNLETHTTIRCQLSIVLFNVLYLLRVSLVDFQPA